MRRIIQTKYWMSEILDLSMAILAFESDLTCLITPVAKKWQIIIVMIGCNKYFRSTFIACNISQTAHSSLHSKPISFAALLKVSADLPMNHSTSGRSCNTDSNVIGEIKRIFETRDVFEFQHFIQLYKIKGYS